MSPISSPITTLTPELLLLILECFSPHQTSYDPATLCSIARCCKAWFYLAQSVLYCDVILDDQKLAKFGDAPTTSLCKVRFLTLRLKRLPRDPVWPDAAEKAESTRLQTLNALARHVSRMNRLQGFSIHANILRPHDTFVSPYLQTISLLIDSLPTTCVFLEVDVLSDVTYTGTTGPSHICNSIRYVMARLQHLRLRVPWMCPALLATPRPGKTSDTDFEFVAAPSLRTLTINCALREPGHHSLGHHTSSCWTPGRPNAILGLLGMTKVHVAEALHSDDPRCMTPALEGFLVHNPKIECLQVIESQHSPNYPLHRWAAWIRRDFMDRTSMPIPVIGFDTSGGESCMLRLPCHDSDYVTEDCVATWEVAEELVEGLLWTSMLSGLRLPRQVLSVRGLESPSHWLTGSALKQNMFQQTVLQLWEHESVIGQLLLPTGPGPLTKQWDVTEITPNGWRRDNRRYASMLRS